MSKSESESVETVVRAKHGTGNCYHKSKSCTWIDADGGFCTYRLEVARAWDNLHPCETCEPLGGEPDE